MVKFFEQGYFSCKQELFLAIFSGACILGGLFEILYAPAINQTTQQILEFIVIFFLLNELHIFLTPLMLFSTDSGRQFMKEAHIELGLLKKAVVLLSVFFVVMFLMLYSIRGFPMALALGLVVCWSHYHAARQSWGMSSIYRRISTEHSIKWDRWLFAPIGLVHILFYFILIFRMKPDLELINYFSYASLACVSVYFFVPVFREKKFWSWGRFYDLRLFVYPLAIKGSFLVLAIHGIEYLLITQKFFGSEKKKGKVFQSVFWLCLVAFVFMVSFRALSLDLTREPIKEWIGMPWLASFLVATSLTFKVFHFWADGLLFTRQYASSRKWILSHVGVKSPNQNSDPPSSNNLSSIAK